MRASDRSPYLALTLLSALFTGCASGPGSSLRSDGFNHGAYPYVVNYADAAQARLLPEEWRLDNYKPFEQPTSALTKTSPDWTVPLEPKEGQTISVAIDGDDDGKVDTRITIPTFDLNFVHTRTAGTIWVRTFPVSGHLREKELRILAQDYVDAVSGVGLTGVQLGAGKVLVQQRRFATRTLSAEPITIAGHEAFAATFEVANVDQLQLAPDARWERARVILVRTPFHFFNEAIDGAQLPVFMVLGYENLPSDFDKQLPDFERFIKQIVTMPDDAELEKIAERMLACGGEDPMKAKLSIDERGTVSWILFEKERKETPMDCVPSALKQLHLHGTGHPRKLQFSFQHSYPSRARPPAAVTPPPALPDQAAKPPTP